MSEELPIAIEHLKEQCGGMVSIVEQVLDEFLTQAPTDISEMAEKFAADDLLAMSKAAHRLKGTAGVLGASKLHPLCAAVEMAGKDGRKEDAAREFEELKIEAQHCVDAVPVIKAMLSSVSTAE